MIQQKSALLKVDILHVLKSSSTSKIYVVGAQREPLSETILSSTHSIRLNTNTDIVEVRPVYSSLSSPLRGTCLH